MVRVGCDIRSGRSALEVLLGIHEEKQSAREERAAETAPENIIRERAFGNNGIFDLVTLSAGPLNVVIYCTPELVGSLAGNGIDAGARETALPDVVRRDIDLDLIDGIEGYRLCVSLTAEGTGEAEGIIEIGAVNRDVVLAGVRAGEAEAVGARFKPGEILNGA